MTKRRSTQARVPRRRSAVVPSSPIRPPLIGPLRGLPNMQRHHWYGVGAGVFLAGMLFVALQLGSSNTSNQRSSIIDRAQAQIGGGGLGGPSSGGAGGLDEGGGGGDGGGGGGPPPTPGPINNPLTHSFIRLGVYEGVVSIVNGVNALELGNAGRDIAATGNINFRPSSTNPVSAFYKVGTGQGLYLDQKLQVGGSRGQSADATGVAIFNNSTDSALRAEQASTGYAGYFKGAVTVTGNLTTNIANCTNASGKLWTDANGVMACGTDNPGGLSGAVAGFVPFFFPTGNQLTSSAINQNVNGLIGFGSYNYGTTKPLVDIIGSTVRLDPLTNCDLAHGQRLYADASGIFKCTAESNPVTGNDNYLARFSNGATEIASSILSDNGSQISMGAPGSSAPRFHIEDASVTATNAVQARANQNATKNAIAGYQGPWGSVTTYNANFNGSAVYGEGARANAAIRGTGPTNGSTQNAWAGYFIGDVEFTGSVFVRPNGGFHTGSPISLEVGDPTTGYGPANSLEAYNNSTQATNALAASWTGNVNGSSPAVYGDVRAGTTCSGTCSAIFGQASGGKGTNKLWAGYFDGDVKIGLSASAPNYYYYLCLNGWCRNSWPDPVANIPYVCQGAATNPPCFGAYLYTEGTQADEGANGIKLWFQIPSYKNSGAQKDFVYAFTPGGQAQTEIRTSVRYQ